MSRGTPEHGRLSAAIVRALPQTDECRVYSSDTLLYVEKAQHSTYADASIVCGAILMRGAKDKNGESLGEAVTNPSVLIEVLSRSTEAQDRNERFVLFQQLDSLEEYVLISQDERRIEVRRRAGRSWSFEVKHAGETIRSHGVDLAVRLTIRHGTPVENAAASGDVIVTAGVPPAISAVTAGAFVPIMFIVVRAWILKERRMVSRVCRRTGEQTPRWSRSGRAPCGTLKGCSTSRRRACSASSVLARWDRSLRGWRGPVRYRRWGPCSASPAPATSGLAT